VKHFIKKEIVNCYLCGLETKNIRQFMDHRRDKHKIFKKLNASNVTKPLDSIFANLNQENVSDEVVSDTNEENYRHIDENEIKVVIIKKFLSMKDKFKIPDSEGNHMFNEFLKLFSLLLEVQNPKKFIEELQKITKSTYLQNKFVSNNLIYVKTIEIKLETDSYHYIPILESLKSIISVLKIYNLLIKEKRGKISFKVLVL